MRSLSLLLCAVVSAAVPVAPPLCISSLDLALGVCVDTVTGAVSSLVANNQTLTGTSAAITTLVGGGAARDGPPIVAAAPDGAITISSRWLVSGDARAPAGAGALVIDTLTATADTVHWHTRVEGLITSPWSLPIITSVMMGMPSGIPLKLWAPWDRGTASSFPGKFVDALQPSDNLPSGWWDGAYRLGSARGRGFSDYIIAPLVALLSADPDTLDVGVSFALSPTDEQFDVALTLDGDNNAFSFTRTNHRLAVGKPYELDADLVPHAADWRASLGFSVARDRAWWEPANAEVFNTTGLGSYSSYLGNLTSPALAAMSYALNWDLSGRFFPYQAMFLPPVGRGVQWLNDPQGSQPRANCTFESISAWYATMAAKGLLDLSYFNVNEFGIDVTLPPKTASMPVKHMQPPRTPLSEASSLSWDTLLLRALGLKGATCVNSWQNASACLIESFLSAVVTDAWVEVNGAASHGAFVSWQGSIIVDPGQKEYHAFMLEQITRKILFLDAFAGIIVDRSDWMDVYNLAADDGLSFITGVTTAGGDGTGGVAASMKLSYAAVLDDLRTALSAAPALRERAHALVEQQLGADAAAAFLPRVSMAGAGIILQNTVGTSRIDQFKPFDGQFSEGRAVNGIGLLGIASPTILWTNNLGEVESAPEVFFQGQLYMGVCPMAPFPQNDHAIAWSDAAIALYLDYGPLFGAISNRVWLLEPHILRVQNVSGSTPAKANAFVTIVDVTATPADALEQALIVPIVLGVDAQGTASVVLRGFERAWGVRAVHPLMRHRRAREGFPPVSGVGGVGGYELDVLYPGGDGKWQPLANVSCAAEPCDLVQPVPLMRGAAVLRVRRAPAAASMTAPPPFCDIPPYVDIRTVPADLEVPPFVGNMSHPIAPAPGLRVFATVPGTVGAAWFSLYLPRDYTPNKSWPVIIEFGGNGPFLDKYGDTSSGRPEDTYLGYGLSGGVGAIWASLPMLSADGSFVETYWWGCPVDSPPAGSPPSFTPRSGCSATTNVSATVAYVIAAVQHIVSAYHGDPACVVVAGFSRGAIGVNYIGLHNDAIASLWAGSIAYAHYDGQPEDAKWPYPDAGPPASYTRLARLGSRPQFICSEVNSSTVMTRPYIEDSGVRVDATYMSTGFCNHNSQWTLRPSHARDALRAWWVRLVGAPAAV